MADHPNAQLARKGYAAFAAGDLDTIRAMFHPDIVWHTGGKSPLAGDYKGIDEVFGFFGRILQETGGQFFNEVHDAIANDEHTIVLVTQTAERNGRKLSLRAVNVEHVTDGKVTESWFFYEDQGAADEFWS